MHKFTANVQIDIFTEINLCRKLHGQTSYLYTRKFTSLAQRERVGCINNREMSIIYLHYKHICIKFKDLSCCTSIYVYAAYY